MRQGAQGWHTGMTLRDGMGREVGERFRIVGNGNKFIFWRQRVVFWEWKHGYKNNW